MHTETLAAVRRLDDATLNAGAPPVIERYVVSGHIDVERAAIEGVRIEQGVEDLVASCLGLEREAPGGPSAPPWLVLLDGLQQPSGLELVHQLARALAARADLAQHSRIRGGLLGRLACR